jgi:hypothetical protein
VLQLAGADAVSSLLFWTCWNGAELGRAAPPLDLSVNHSVDEGAGRWNRGHRAA